MSAISFATLRKVNVFLDANYDRDARKWKDTWRDETAAAALQVPKAVVTEVRKMQGGSGIPVSRFRQMESQLDKLIDAHNTLTAMVAQLRWCMRQTAQSERWRDWDQLELSAARKFPAGNGGATHDKRAK